MRKLNSTFGIWGLAAIGILVAGCLISGTFVIVESFSFTAQSGFYYYEIDLTNQSDWEDHKDQIDAIDAVGAEFFITSTESGNVTFNVFVDSYSGSANPSAVPSSAKVILEDLDVAPGTTHITYAQSLGYLKNLDALKALVKTGKFDYYATSSGNEGTSFKVDSGKVIVTFSASE